MPRIGLDLRPTEEGFKAHFGRGTGRYTTEVVRRLLQLNPGAPGGIELCPVGSAELGATRLERLLYRLAPLGRVTLEQQLLLPRRLSRLHVDLFHFFSHVDAPASCTVPYILTVLDLIPLRFPELYTIDKPNWRFRFARYLELKAIARARGIIAISEATKRDLVNILGIDPENIVVTPLAVGEEFQPRDNPAEDELALELTARRRAVDLPSERPVVLYVGGIDARKNIPFLVDTFAKLLAGQDWGAARPLLVLVGRYERDNNYPRLLEQIRRLELASDVLLRGFVEDVFLPSFYHAASVVAFPSIYEGFGLPVLEAMACAVPVIAGDNSSIPEVAGESAVLLPDNDEAAWITALQEILSSPKRQLELGARGAARAKLFSWENSARATLAAYRYFLAGGFGRSRSAEVERSVGGAETR